MASALQQPRINEDFSSVVLSSAAEIQNLKSSIRCSLSSSGILLDPEFFLSSVSARWKPKVVAVRSGHDLIGVVYAKERMISGLPIGVVYADLSFGSILLGHPVQQQNAFRIALESLLDARGTRGIRLRVLRGGPEVAAIRQVIGSRRLDVHFSRVKDHARLSLPHTYEQLIQRFGTTTRHNFRYYRRRSEAAGNVYVERLSLEELRSAISSLMAKCSRGANAGCERALKMIATADRPLAVGLKHKNGEWMSVIGGVFTPETGVLLAQMNNDLDFPRESLSVVLRGYLIESLIRLGKREFIIWAGTAPPLSRYVTYIRTLGIHLDVPNYPWRLARRVVSKCGPWLPKQLQTDAQWIAPFSGNHT